MYLTALKEIYDLDEEKCKIDSKIGMKLFILQHIFMNQYVCIKCGITREEHKNTDHNFLRGFNLSSFTYISKKPFYMKEKEGGKKEYYLAVRKRELVVVVKDTAFSNGYGYIELDELPSDVEEAMILSGALENFFVELKEYLQEVVSKKTIILSKLDEIHNNIVQALKEKGREIIEQQQTQ